MSFAFRTAASAVVAALLLGVALTTAQQVVRHTHRHVIGAGGSAPPAAYNISNVPWNQQITDFDCGAASSQMVLQYWAQTPAEFGALNQWDIMDVARTTSSSGTWSTDVLRVGRFSALSTPAVDWYAANTTCPGGVECHGFAHRPVGAAAYMHMSNAFWLDAVKSVIAADHPVIILMNWDATPDRDGHYRVLTGYDDALQMVYFNDPWGRDQAPVQAFTYHNFSIAWNYTEQGHAGPIAWQPYWAALFAPWQVHVSVKPEQSPSQSPAPDGAPASAAAQVQWYAISATVTYPLFSAFPVDEREHTTADTLAAIGLSDGLLLDSTQRSSVRLGESKPGAQYTLHWRAFANATAVRTGGDAWLSAQWVRVTARGVTRASADSIYCCGGSAQDSYARMAATRAPLRGADARATPRAAAVALDAADAVDSTEAVDATASSAEYYFPAYDYADVIGGGATLSLAELL